MKIKKNNKVIIINDSQSQSIIMECHIPNTYKNIIKPKLENYGYIVEQIMQNESPFEMLVAKHDG